MQKFCKDCGADLTDNKSRYGTYCPPCGKKYLKKRHEELKLAALMHYSHGSMKCARCGSTGLLCIDHINGGGKEHRKQMGGNQIYRWLKNHNYPEFWLSPKGIKVYFQVLCIDCNSFLGQPVRPKYVLIDLVCS